MKHKFEKYCKDYANIENYEKAKKDNFKGWCCHHRLETHTSDGERRLVDISVEELQALRMYYKRPASELIFLPVGEHTSLHDEGENHPMYGKHHSDESKKKMSEVRKGKPKTEEWRKRIGEANKGKKMSEEARRKVSEANKGKKRSEEHKKKISKAQKGNTYAKGMHWYNNGKENKYCYECPDGFVPGRLFTNINKGNRHGKNIDN